MLDSSMYDSTDPGQSQASSEATRRWRAQSKAAAAWSYRTDFAWDVRPANDGAKHPNVPWSEQRAPNPFSPDEIALRWQDEPWLNIIILTGRRSGMIVGDIDPRHGGALETLWGMGWPGETVIALSGSGGWHVYAQCPAEGLRSIPTYAQGIELKADGALVVAPPSRHPNGNLYQWMDGHDPWTLPLAPLPESVLADIRARGAAPVEPVSEPLTLSARRLRGRERRVPRMVRRAVERARNGQDGGRHNSGLWLACQLRDLRVSDDVGMRAMLSYQRAIAKLEARHA
ncbi:MAG TPA: bifunctional DNA primase/polymerase [Ktedonobacterales bacterium]